MQKRYTKIMAPEIFDHMDVYILHALIIWHSRKWRKIKFQKKIGAISGMKPNIVKKGS